MSRKPDGYDELTRLVSALLDGWLTAEEMADLEALLRQNAATRQLYMQLVDQEIELSCLVVSAQGETSVRDKPLTLDRPVRTTGGANRLWRRWLLGGAVAAGLVALLVVLIPIDRFRQGRVPSPQPPLSGASIRDSWVEDFERGLRSPWYGRIVSNNLPVGSKYGIAAVLREYPVGGPAYVIQLPEDWNQGLFALTAGSTLNVTYRLDTPTYVNVFMHTIPVDRGAVGYEMYQLKGDGFRGRMGEWQTASVPFSQFIRKIPVGPTGTRQFVGGPPRSGEFVTTLSFSSVDRLDLVIDRVWITPTKPMREETPPMQGSPP